jgi:hypothetical protein
VRIQRDQPPKTNMKKFPAPSRLVPLLLLGALALGGCKKSGTPAPGSAGVASAEKTSFQEVTAQLDPGGNLYVYLSTEQVLDGISGKLAKWHEVLGSLPDLKGEDRENADRLLTVLGHLAKDSGLENVSGVGLSSIARERGFYRGKIVVHHYPGKGDGFLWTMFGPKPHALAQLDLLPSTTAVAASADLDLAQLWAVIRKEAGQSDIPNAEEALKNLTDTFQTATGLKWDAVLASLGGEYGVVLTLDESRMINVPLPGGGLEIPEPALMLVAKVKDDLIFNRVDKALADTGMPVTRTDKPNLKMRTVSVPLPLPIQLRPTLARSGDYLFLATTDAVIQEALAVQAGQKPGLKAGAEFKRLTTDLPRQGNQFMFVSPRLGKVLVGLQQQALAHAPAQAQWLESLLSTNASTGSCSVGANTDTGWIGVANGSQHPAKLLVAGTAVPLVLAAIAAPNFARARNTSQQAACINHLRQLDSAKQQWALEHQKSAGSVPTRADLREYLRGPFPTCPSGGAYKLNPVDQSPACSKPGHKLEQ